MKEVQVKIKIRNMWGNDGIYTLGVAVNLRTCIEPRRLDGYTTGHAASPCRICTDSCAQA